MMRRVAVLLLLGVLLGLAGALLPSPAQADGDPASDILISDNVFLPYAPNAVDKGLQAALKAQLAAAKGTGYDLKVALIASASDMGSVPQLFTDPQKYADLLTTELSFNTKPRVLVILPSGLGGNNLGDNAGAALTRITIESAAGPDGLARAAMQAVGALTKAAGKPVPVPAVALEHGAAGGGGGGGGGVSPVLVFGLPVVLVALLGVVAARRDKRRDEDTGEPPDAQ
jgi:hypothetical protein